jgi:hypothetical protein
VRSHGWNPFVFEENSVRRERLQGQRLA